MPQQDQIERNKPVDSVEKWNFKNPWRWHLIQEQQKKQLFELFERRANEIEYELDKKINEIKEQHKEITEQHKEITEQWNRIEFVHSCINQSENVIQMNEVNFFEAFINWLISCINKHFESRTHYSFFSENMGGSSMESNQNLISGMSV